MEKRNRTQQKHAFTNQNKFTKTQNKTKKLKPCLITSYDIQPGNGQLHKFVTYLLKTVSNLLTASDPHEVLNWVCTHTLTFKSKQLWSLIIFILSRSCSRSRSYAKVYSSTSGRSLAAKRFLAHFYADTIHFFLTRKLHFLSLMAE